MPQVKGQRTGCVKVVNLGDLKTRSFAEAAAEAGYEATITVAQPGGSPVTFCEITVVKEGVWNRTLETADILSTAAPSILGKYVMLGHPKEGSEPGWPEQAMGQVIGFSLEMPEAKLKTLAAMWDNRVPPELLSRLKAGEVLGVSSGHVSFESEKPGEWNGKPYDFTTDKMYFEHVAIVPIGACSVEDGCEAHVISQNKVKHMKNNDKETKKVAQEEGAAAEATDPEVLEVPPPLFKTPDELTTFVTEQLGNENKELRDSQLRLALDFVLNTVSEFGWRIFDMEDGDAKAAAIVSFVTKAAAAWKAGEELFTPEGAEETEPAEAEGTSATTVTQSKQKSWRDGKRSSKRVVRSAGEGEVDEVIYNYPVLGKTEDGKTQVSWNSTKSEEDAKTQLEAFNAKVTAMQNTTTQAESVARDMLITSLKTAMPKLTDTSIEKYKSMDLLTLQGLVSDLGQNVPAIDDGAGEGTGTVAAEAGDGSGLEAEGASVAAIGRVQSPTAVGLQKINKGKGKMTFAEAQKRLKKETGISII